MTFGSTARLDVPKGPSVNRCTSDVNQGCEPTMRNRTERGFTLSEMMVVIAVMGIIFLAAVPSISSYVNSTRLSGAAGSLVSDLQLARSLASSQRTTFEVRRTTDGYSIVRLTPETTVLSKRLPGGVSFAAADTTTFYSWGLTEPATITLRHRDRTSVVRVTQAGQVKRD